MVVRRILLGPTIAIVLSACGASEVLHAGPSTFQVSAQEGLITGGWPAAEREAMAKGQEYCSAMGQHFALLQENNSGVPGWTPLSTSITFSCGPDLKAEAQAADAQCSSDMQTPELDPIRHKVELSRSSADEPPPFEIASNDSFPTASDLPVIAKWAAIRDECIKRANALPNTPLSGNALQVTFFEQDRAFLQAVTGRVSELIVALYHSKLTYAEFAQNRYEISKDGAAAERQFRAANQLADHERQMQAQQQAQQQFQNNLLAWSAYMQAVNARQPQQIHVDGSVRLKTNCTSQRFGNFVSTNCY